MTYAALNGHQNIVELMIEKGADNYNHAMSNAASQGHESIVRLLLDHGG